MAFGRPSKSYGPAGKILAQAEYLKAYHVEIRVIFLSVYPLKKKDYLPGEYTHFYLNSPDNIPLISRVRNRKILINRLLRYLKNQYFDFLYLRYPPYIDNSLMKLMKHYGKKLVLEHNTIELIEKWRNKNYFIWLLEKNYGKKFLHKALASICVTNEIAVHQQKRSCSQLKTFVIPNGIEVNSLPVRKAPEYDNQNLDILFVAKIYPHHGLDRLIKGLAEFSGNVNVRVHVVGEGPELQKNKELTERFGLEDVIFFHGKLFGEKLKEMFNSCHIAMGSLALHRNGLKEGATLKVREYTSRGIPFMISYRDVDLQEKAITPYYQTLPESEENIDFTKVVRFASDVLQESQHPATMNVYARHKMDMKSKMEDLKNVFVQLKEEANG